MTTHYIDVTVIPDPETSAPQLMGALYEKLHLALARDHIDSIGVSFPRYSMIPKTLGSLLRIHGTDTILQQLQQTDWLKGIRDHVRITAIAEVPQETQHRVIQRKQFKTSAERLRRRRMRRKNETEQYVKQHIPDTIERIPNLPYVQIHSRSTGQLFCLYIATGSLQPHPISGAFTTYGLSAHTTIPWF